MIVLTIAPGHPLRRPVEAHIRGVYAREYGATVGDLPHLLVAGLDSAGAPAAAAGLRLGWDQSFSACYLDEPVERILQHLAGRRADPRRILEVTTLAGSGHGAGLRLVDGVIGLGRRLGMDWGVFTATRRLRLALRRHRYDLLELAPARRERAAEPSRWGSYYDADPWVCAIDDRRRRGSHRIAANDHGPAVLLHA